MILTAGTEPIDFLPKLTQASESMRGLFPLLILLGALLGLFGQGMALAKAPAAQVPQTISVAAESDCMKAMQKDPSGEPCKGITLDCIAAMGCIVPFTQPNEQPSLSEPLLPRNFGKAPLVTPLIGRVPSPEHEPPTS